MKRFEALLDTIHILRSENGCPWDRKQTHESLIPYLQEESAEVIDAIIAQSSISLKEELGDLLLQILLHSEIASEKEAFNFLEVADGLNDKIIRRHPHLFAGKIYQDEAEQRADWERIKAEENGLKEGNKKRALLDSVAQSLSGLTRAYQLQAKAASVGFDWDNIADVSAKIEEEYNEFFEEVDQEDTLKMEQEMGDLLFAVVNLARHLNIDPDRAIARTNQKFYDRFKYVEQAVNGEFEGYTLEALDRFWDDAKKKGL